MRLSRQLARLAVAALATASQTFAGDVTARIIITKRLTRKAVTAAPYDLRGAASLPSSAPSGIEAEFDRTVVILEGGPNTVKTPTTVTINQTGSRFDPEMLVIPVGSTVQFPNLDPIFHNVFSLSGAKSFDLGYYPQGKSKAVKFEKPGVVQVYCHIHSNMYASIVVTDSGWFEKPTFDKGLQEGLVHFADVPPGHYKAVAWHKVAGYYHAEIDVPQTGTATVTLHVPLEDAGNQNAGTQRVSSAAK